MRLHGLEKVGGAKSAASQTRRAPVALIAAIVGVVALGGGYYAWAKRASDVVEGPPPVAPLSLAQTRGYLRNAGVEAGALANLFVADDAVEKFASKAVSGKSGAMDKAKGVVAAIRDRAAKRGFVTWALSEPRDSQIRSAAETLGVISKDGAADKSYPLELAALAASALRSEDVDAMVAIVENYPGEKAPVDPSGYLGYFAVAVPKAAGSKEYSYFDVYAGRTATPDAADVNVVTDIEAIGYALNVRAITSLLHDGDSTKAYADSELATKLVPRGAEIRGVRGAVVLASGNYEEGVRELEAAAQIRNDAPRRNNIGGLLLVKGDLDGAQKQVGAALDAAPEFAGAHATLAAIHLAQQENDDALRELETAKRIDPDLHTLPILFANYYAVTGEFDHALEFAKQAVAHRPHDPQGHLLLARLYRQASRYDDMRKEAKAALEAVPSAQRDGMREVLKQVLGPTVFDDEPVPSGSTHEAEEAPSDEPLQLADPSAAPTSLPSPDFRLGQDSRLLGDDAKGTEAQPRHPQNGGTILQLGDTSKIHLGGQGEGLHLDMNR